MPYSLMEAKGHPITNENGDFLIYDDDTGSQLWIPANQVHLVTEAIEPHMELAEPADVAELEEEDGNNLAEILESEAEDDTTEAPEDPKNNKVWTKDDNYLLIELYRREEKSFENFHKKKTVWEKITKEINTVAHKTFSPLNVENKWKSLKRTYKSIKIKNATSGSQRKSWQFFNAVDAILCNKPEIDRPAIASSSGGVVSRNGITSADKESLESVTSSSPCSSADKIEFFKRKRNAPNVNDRHREKMARQDKFLELFEDMVKKI